MLACYYYIMIDETTSRTWSLLQYQFNLPKLTGASSCATPPPGMQVTAPPKESHGAFRPFMTGQRETFFMVNRDDLEGVKSTLRRERISQANDDEKKEKVMAFFLKHCRSRMLAPDAFVERIKSAVQLFDIVDDATGEPLFRPPAIEALTTLCGHASGGCLSKPDRHRYLPLRAWHQQHGVFFVFFVESLKNILSTSEKNRNN